MHWRDPFRVRSFRFQWPADLATSWAFEMESIVLGWFILVESGSVMMLVFVPLLMPSVRALGIDVTYFGIVVTLNFMIGLITPPYGLLLFVMSSLTRVPLMAIIREIWPFVLTLGALLLVLTWFPQIILFLPHAFGYK